MLNQRLGNKVLNCKMTYYWGLQTPSHPSPNGGELVKRTCWCQSATDNRGFTNNLIKAMFQVFIWGWLFKKDIFAMVQRQSLILNFLSFPCSFSEVIVFLFNKDCFLPCLIYFHFLWTFLCARSDRKIYLPMTIIFFSLFLVPVAVIWRKFLCNQDDDFFLSHFTIYQSLVNP